MPPVRRGAGPIPAGTVGVVLAVLLASGCARPVAVDEPTPDPGAAAACRALIAALPDELDHAGRRRDVRPDSPLTAAYGDPPVTIRCGVPVPAALGAESQLVTVDGVDWLPEELTAGWLMTTVGRAASVEITVPDALGPAPSIAAALAGPIAATVPASPRS